MCWLAVISPLQVADQVLHLPPAGEWAWSRGALVTDDQSGQIAVVLWWCLDGGSELAEALLDALPALLKDLVAVPR